MVALPETTRTDVMARITPLVVPTPSLRMARIASRTGTTQTGTMTTVRLAVSLRLRPLPDLRQSPVVNQATAPSRVQVIPQVVRSPESRLPRPTLRDEES